MKPATQLILTLSAIATFTAAPAAIVWAIDPLQIYRARSDQPIDLQRLPRYQIAGLIHTYLADSSKSFDTIIMGTSLSQNFAQSQVQAALGSSGVIKMAMAGAWAQTQIFIVDRALQTENVKRVIWEINDRSFAVMPTNEANANHVFPAYLYEGGLGLHQYLFNVDNLIESLRQLHLLNQTSEWRAQGDEWGTWYYSDALWHDKRAKHKRNRFHQYRKDLAKGMLKPYPTIESLLKAFPPPERYVAIDEIITLVKKHTTVSFDFFIPPVSVAFYAHQEPQDLSLRFGMANYAVKHLATLPNVRLFAFNNVSEIVTDLSLYRDLSHYHPDINAWISETIAAGDHQLTAANINAYEEAWYRLITAFRVTDLDTGT